MRQPLVSVIIAVRNGERFLAAAIESVLVQDWHPLEILIVDGHSTDGTSEIAAAWPQVRYIGQIKRGVGDAYNLGISAARGEFVAFLSHDDLWVRDKLSCQMDYMLRQPGIQYTVGRAKFFLQPKENLPPGFRAALLSGDHVAYIMETMLARSSVFSQVGEFDSELTSGEDVDWFSRAMDRQIPHAVIDRVLVHKRIHGANTSLQGGNNQMLLKLLRRSIARKEGLKGAGCP